MRLTTRGLAAALLGVGPRSILALAPIAGSGISNRHWLVEVSGGGRYVLRRYRTPLLEPGLSEKEARLHALLGAAAVPVPRIVASRAEGSLMEPVPGVPGLAGEAAWAVAAVALGRVHQLRFPGRVIPWRPFVQVRLGEHAGRLLARGAISQEQADRARRLAHRFGPALDSAPSRLIHGDCRAANLLSQDGQATWIDWEAAMAGDPGWDLAQLAADEPPPAFWNAYGELPRLLPLYLLANRLAGALQDLHPVLASVSRAGNDYLTRLDRELGQLETAGG